MPGAGRACSLCVSLALAALGSAAANSASAAESYPRILRVDASRVPQVSVLAVVPPLLSAQTLPTSAFEVVENGERRPVSSAARLPWADLRVMLIIDSAVPATVLAAQQGAARDFVFRLPAKTQVGVVVSGPEPDVVSFPGTDREATVRSVAGLRTQTGNLREHVSAALDLALSQLEPAPDRNVVVAVDARPSVTTVPYAVSQAALTARAAVYPIVLRPAPAGYLGRLPELTGGRLLEVDPPEQLLAAYDTVADELQGRYRVGYTTDLSRNHVAELTVAAGSVRGQARFTVNPATGSAAGRATGAGSGSLVRVLGITVAAAVLLAGLALLAVRREPRLSSGRHKRGRSLRRSAEPGRTSRHR